MGIAMGFMAAKHLFTASAIGLFENLADGPATVDELAVKCAVPYRTLRISVDAMASLGLLGGGLLSEQRGCRNLSQRWRGKWIAAHAALLGSHQLPSLGELRECGAFGLGAAPIQSFQ